MQLLRSLLADRRCRRCLHQSNGVQAVALVVVALAGIRDLSTVRRLEIPPPLTQVISIYHVCHGYLLCDRTPCNRRHLCDMIGVVRPHHGTATKSRPPVWRLDHVVPREIQRRL